MNRIEEFKKQLNGLDVLGDILRYSRSGPEAISERDKVLMKWYGVFFRKHSPGFFMLRARIPNGIASAAQVRALAEVTRDLGAGFADLTTRQQVQLRSVRIERIPEIFERLRRVGLTTLQTGMDNVRNVMGCPVSGLSPRERSDGSTVARELTAQLVGNRAYSNLPRKFNVAITGCPDNCVPVTSQDLGLAPASVDGRDGFNVFVGGKMGSGGFRPANALDVFVEPARAAALCLAIVRVYRKHGTRDARNRNRFAFLVDEWGIERVRAAVEQAFGEPLERAGKDQRARGVTDHIGVYRQRDGKSWVGLLVPAGRLDAGQIFELARLSETYGSAEVRFTAEQNVILPDIGDEALRRLQEEPLLRELRYDPPEVLRGLVVCTGIDFCDLALVDTKARALPMTRSLAAKLAERKDPLRIHWSGCPAGCGNHHLADIGLEGARVRIDGKVVEAVDVYVGGRWGTEPRAGQRIMENVPCTDLPAVLEYLVRHFPRQRASAEAGR